jgi:hypothetical protein
LAISSLEPELGSIGSFGKMESRKSELEYPEIHLGDSSHSRFRLLELHHAGSKYPNERNGPPHLDLVGAVGSAGLTQHEAKQSAFCRIKLVKL